MDAVNKRCRDGCEYHRACKRLDVSDGPMSAEAYNRQYGEPSSFTQPMQDTTPVTFTPLPGCSDRGGCGEEVCAYDRLCHRKVACALANARKGIFSPKKEKKQKNSGWSTDYYQLPPDAKELQDLIEFREMNFAQGNMFKAVWRMGEKDGTTSAYDLRKIIWFAKRELMRLGEGVE